MSIANPHSKPLPTPSYTQTPATNRRGPQCQGPNQCWGPETLSDPKGRGAGHVTRACRMIGAFLISNIFVINDRMEWRSQMLQFRDRCREAVISNKVSLTCNKLSCTFLKENRRRVISIFLLPLMFNHDNQTCLLLQLCTKCN